MVVKVMVMDDGEMESGLFIDKSFHRIVGLGFFGFEGLGFRVRVKCEV